MSKSARHEISRGTLIIVLIVLLAVIVGAYAHFSGVRGGQVSPELHQATAVKTKELLLKKGMEHLQNLQQPRR
jgi:hypothetical protein